MTLPDSRPNTLRKYLPSAPTPKDVPCLRFYFLELVVFLKRASADRSQGLQTRRVSSFEEVEFFVHRRKASGGRFVSTTSREFEANLEVPAASDNPAIRKPSYPRFAMRPPTFCDRMTRSNVLSVRLRVNSHSAAWVPCQQLSQRPHDHL